MATTLFTLLRKAYLALGQMEVTTATGGSTTTIIDTKLAEIYGDDDLINNAAFIIRDAGGAGAAPEGEAQIISDNVQATTTITLKAALTVAVAAGDTIGIAKNVWPLYTMIEIVNDALASLGTISLVDESITTTEDTTEYTLPVAMKYKLDRVQFQNDLVTNDYVDVHNWSVIPATAGSTGLLTFTSPFIAGRKLKLWYEAEHPRLSAMSDKLSETIHSELATRLIVSQALEYQTRRTSGTDSFMLQTANKAMADLQDARVRFPIMKAKKTKILTPNETVTDYLHGH